MSIQPVTKRILVCEDSDTVARLWVAVLEQSGYEVVGPVSSAEKALEEAEKKAVYDRWSKGLVQREEQLKKIEVLQTGRSPRIVRARVVGSTNSSSVSGDTLRFRLGLRSTDDADGHDGHARDRLRRNGQRHPGGRAWPEAVEAVRRS